MSKFLLLLFLSVFALANEGGEEAHSPAPAGPESSDQRAIKEIMELEKQVTTTGAKITAKEASVKELIRQKQAEKEPAKVNEIIKLLQKEHRDLGELIKEYNTQYGMLQYRYPERGVTLQRKYKRFSSQSLEDMEKSIGLEGHLNRSREKVERVYGVDRSKSKRQSKPGQVESEKEKESILAPSTISK